MIQVYEVSAQICFAEPVCHGNTAEKMSRFIDTALGGTKEFRRFHASRRFKSYTFDLPYPLESEHIYRAGKIYTFRIRTVDGALAEYLAARIQAHRAAGVLGMSGELCVIPRRFLKTVYTLTPVVMKTEQGYWRKKIHIREYGERLKKDLINKYNHIQQTELTGDFPLYQQLELRNAKPVRVPCRDIVLLGDKVSMTACGNEMAQELLYMALGTGLGENNARGCGFLSYRAR